MNILRKLFGIKKEDPVITVPYSITKEEAIAKICINAAFLGSLSAAFRNDRDIVLTAVSKDGDALQYASDELKNDKEVVLVACAQKGYALVYASDELKNDKDAVLVACAQNGGSLQYTSDTLKNDKDVVLTAITQNGYALEFASEELQNTKDIALVAVTQDGFVLQLLCIELRHDKDVVLAAVYQDGNSFQFAYGIVRQDPVLTFVAKHKLLISATDWPLVWKALQEKSEYFLNPEPYMKALTDGIEYPYLMLAHYALGKDVIIEPEALPTIEF